MYDIQIDIPPSWQLIYYWSIGTQSSAERLQSQGIRSPGTVVPRPHLQSECFCQPFDVLSLSLRLRLFCLFVALTFIFILRPPRITSAWPV